jgi:hypothetical protein
VRPFSACVALRIWLATYTPSSSDRGDLWVAEAVARDLPQVSLEAALRFVHLYGENESPKYERAALRRLRVAGYPQRAYAFNVHLAVNVLGARAITLHALAKPAPDVV